MKFLLYLYTVLFFAYLPYLRATSSSTQNPLFDRVDDLLTIKSQQSQANNPQALGIEATSLVSMGAGVTTQVGQDASTADGGGDTLFGNDFSVTVPDEDPNPLAGVSEMTESLAQENAADPQENRLLNNAATASPTTEETTESPTDPSPDFGLNPDLNPELAGYSAAARAIAENPDLITNLPSQSAEAEQAGPSPGPSTTGASERGTGAGTEQAGGAEVAEVTEEQEENVFFGSEQDAPRAQWSLGYTLVVCIIITTVLILVIFLRNLFNKYFNPILLQKISYASRDVIIILLVVTLILWLKWLGVNLFDLPLNEICLSLSVFALGWLFWCVVLIVYAQANSVNWEEKEIQGKFRDRILKDYRETFDRLEQGEKLSPDEQKIFRKNESQIRYSLMRQNFIQPSYLPVITESFLREDFNFAGYLTLCLEKAFTNLFRLSLAALVTLFAIVLFWFGITRIGVPQTEAIVFGVSVPLVSMILLLILRSKFNNISNDLRTPFSNPHNVDFIKQEAQKDPWANLQNPLPPYLAAPQEAFQRPPRIFQGQKRPNLQEMMFWRSSPLFSLTIIHGLAVCQIIWATIYLGYYVPANEVVFNVTFSLLVSAIFLLNIFYFIPSSLLIYNMIANIEMRKDRDLIKRIVQDQRTLLRQSLIKLYRLLKSARREFSEEMSPGVRLRDFTIRMIKESFRTIVEDDSWEIEIQDLPRLVHLSGSKLEKDELVYLARGASEDLQTIFIDDFIDTIEVMAKDVKLDPYETSNEVLRSLAVKDDDFFVLKEFRELLLNHKVLSRFDIEEILHELRLTSANGVEAEIPNISSLIRNSIEEHAR